MKRTGSITVLVVHHLPQAREVISGVLEKAHDIEVVGAARNVTQARELILRTHPDVIILDLDMPGQDRLTFLRKLRIHYPVPVIMCGGGSGANRRRALDAVEMGAADFVTWPAVGRTRALRSLGKGLPGKVRAVALSIKVPLPIAQKTRKGPAFRAAGLDPHRYVVGIGASTGGTEAIKVLLSHVPSDFPPVVIVEHMPEGFTGIFAERLNRFSALSVSEAGDGDELVPGTAFVARGGAQLTVQIVDGRRKLRLGSDRAVNLHCPSVGVLFSSLARSVGRNAVGIIMTGMGADGAKELLEMRQAGAITIAQDRRSSVVYGMPKVATELGAAMCIAPPDEIPELVMRRLGKRDARSVGAAVG